MFWPRSRVILAQICILLHARPILPNSTQSALVSAGCASLVFRSAASLAVGKASTKPSPAAVALRQSISSSPSASPKKPRRCKGLVHPQPEIGVGDLDAGPQKDPLAAALGRRRPHRLQDFLRFPEISSVVEGNSVAQRRMPRRDEVLESRRHQGHRLP